MVGGSDGNVVIVEPEIDLVAWFDTELVSQLLGDDDLPFGTNPMSHTTKYNPREAATRPVGVSQAQAISARSMVTVNAWCGP